MVRFKAWTTNLTLGLHVADSSMRSSWSPGRRVTEQLVAHVAELIVAVLVPHSLKENVEVANLAHHVQVSERVCEQTVQVSAPQVAEKFVARVVLQDMLVEISVRASDLSQALCETTCSRGRRSGS